MKKIAVVGSINLDYFVESDRLPQFGETVTGENFFMGFGGKGANQAVAASRLGGEVALFGSIGNDEQRVALLNHFKNENINVDHLNIVEDVHTGAAFIQLHNRDNRIIIVPGANQYTDMNYCKRILPALLEYDVILFQLEIPLEAVEFLIPLLHKHQKTIILDPAPAQRLDESILDCITFMTPNEHEFSIVTDNQSSMDEVLKAHPNKLIITCGDKGAVFCNGSEIVKHSARKISAVDTTGAGDTFTGAFTVAVSTGKSIEECIYYGTKAASLSVMKKGAQSGMPYKHEIDQLAKEV